MTEAFDTPELDAPAETLDSPGRALLAELVATQSHSGDEAAVAALLHTFFEQHDRDAFIDAAGNLRAPADDSVLLTSHMDTVPGGPEVRVVEGDEGLAVDGAVLHGRGCVDATGPLAAMAVAAVEAGVSFAGVVQEETDSAGARHLLADRAAPDAVINGEPSGWDAVTLGYRGLVAGTYTVETPSGHSSRPEPNAIDHAAEWWQTVREAVEDDSAGESGVFDSVTATATAFDGGLSDDGDTVEATVDAQFRVPPGKTPGAVRESVEAATVEGSLGWTDEIPPLLGDPRSSVAAALRAGIRATGGEPTHLRKSGTADANLYADGWDVPVATYGPGNSSLDHAPDERLPLEAFDRSIAALTTACTQLTD